MSAMHASDDSHSGQRAEPSGLTLAFLFLGSVFATIAISLWLWNSNPSVHDGTAFGVPGQVPPGGVAAAAAPQVSGEAAAAAGLDPELVARGQQLASQLGCVACHSATGAQGAGPTWQGVFGSQVPLANGQTVTADDAYLRESILQPDAKIHQGFAPGIMTGAVAGVASQLQSGDTTDALIAYIKSLK